MCSNRLCSRRRNKMNTEGLPAQALKRKKTRRLKKRKPQDDKRYVAMEVPNKRTKGQTAAPENTTQFLMDDREKFEPFNLDAACSPSFSPVSSCSCSTSSVRGSPANDEDFESLSEFVEDFDQLYFEKDFNDFYDSVYAETLLSLTKQELITRYLDLEKKEEELLQQVKTMSPESSNVSPICNYECLKSNFSHQFTRNSLTTESAKNKEAEKKTLKSQVQELRLLNSQLQQENQRLRGC
ncbi:protein HEXIM-like [Actinia tenebrosa]|uniref:Protein HEXIM-like n=1 Tax=Actinia tenebrosa TaxID=6105 RepID=A0A6P8I7A0_ACTTE|nr:protein HEXIM-like [Actinia tenebrosa]